MVCILQLGYCTECLYSYFNVPPAFCIFHECIDVIKLIIVSTLSDNIGAETHDDICGRPRYCPTHGEDVKSWFISLKFVLLPTASSHITEVTSVGSISCQF